MKAIDPTYQPPEKKFDEFPDGKYKVKGITWFTKSDKDLPIVVAQKDGKLVGRFRFKLLDSQEGPPMSLTLPEMALFAKAAGVKNIPPVPDVNYAAMVTKFMMDIANLVADKELEVEVSNGWVNSVPGMTIPEGYYHFYISDISGDKDENGKPKPKVGNWENSLYFYVTFTVEYGEGGKESPYKGVTFTESVPYAIAVIDGEADFKRDEDGAYTSESARMSKLMRLGDPDTFAGEYSPPDPHNLLPYIREKFLASCQMLKGSRVLIERKDKGVIKRRIGLIWSSLDSSDLKSETPKRLIESMGIDDRCREILVEALDKMAGAHTVINGTFELNEVGRKLAKEHFSPLKKEGIIKHGSVEELTPEEITSILTVLQEKVGSEYKEKVVALAVGFTPPVEEEDTPF